MTLIIILVFSSWIKSSGSSDKVYDYIRKDKFLNPELEQQNPSSNWPPRTDEGSLPPFKYPFAFARSVIYSGGWTKSVTVADLPISKKVAGFQTRLIPGGARELHWHTSSEWAYVIYGQARITAVDGMGRAFIDDVKAGDIWLFPGGFPHSVRAIGDKGLFYLSANPGDDSTTSDGTFHLTDWLRHTPADVLAKNFQVNPSLFKNVPKHKFEIYKSQLKEPEQTLQQELKEASKGTGLVPESFSFHTDRMKSNVTRAGGWAKIIDRRNFPATTMAAAIIILHPGAMRELHWHPNDDEWQYYVSGKARMGVFKGEGQARTMDFQAGDVGYVEKSVAHYFENTGKEDLIFVEVFPTPYYEDISLAEWLAHTPSVLVNEHIRTGLEFIESINKTKAVIVP